MIMSEADAAVLARQMQKPKKERMGTWPDECLQRAFVDGASWWQFYVYGSTLFASERDAAEREAVNRYGLPSWPADGYEVGILTSGNHLASLLIEMDVLEGESLEAYRHLSYDEVLAKHGQQFAGIWSAWHAIMQWRDNVTKSRL